MGVLGETSEIKVFQLEIVNFGTLMEMSCCQTGRLVETSISHSTSKQLYHEVELSCIFIIHAINVALVVEAAKKGFVKTVRPAVRLALSGKHGGVTVSPIT